VLNKVKILPPLNLENFWSLPLPGVMYTLLNTGYKPVQAVDVD
jgi:hypothetical protein